MTLQIELQNFVTKKVKPHQQKNTKSNIKNPLPAPEIEHGTFCTQGGCVTSAPPGQLTSFLSISTQWIEM